MSVHFLIAGAAFLLEHKDFVVLQVPEDFAINGGTFQNRCAYFDLTVVFCEQDTVETYGRIFLSRETVNIEFPTFLSLELLTCDVYYNVHFSLFRANSDCKDSEKCL